MTRLPAGSIVVVDWRSGALPREPGGLRRAVVIEDHELFPDSYPNMIVVPLTRDEGLAHRSFAVRIDPTAQNGGTETSWALAHHVTSVSLRRVESTGSQISAEQTAQIRKRLILAVGGE